MCGSATARPPLTVPASAAADWIGALVPSAAVSLSIFPFARPFHQVPAKQAVIVLPAAGCEAMSEAKDKKDYYEVVAHVLRSVYLPGQCAMQPGHAAFDCGRCGVRASLLLGAQPAPVRLRCQSQKRHVTAPPHAGAGRGQGSHS